MSPDNSVIYHTAQEEISHSPLGRDNATHFRMDEGTVFRQNLLRIMDARGLKAATLSRAAGLNPRAVKDIEEGRVQSPKLSTVFALSRALGEDPGEMMGLGARSALLKELVEYLEQYSESEQAQILKALSALPR